MFPPPASNFAGRQKPDPPIYRSRFTGIAKYGESWMNASARRRSTRPARKPPGRPPGKDYPGSPACIAAYHNRYMPRYAAIDVGSNSLRMEVAEVLPGPAGAPLIRILASERQVTRLGESVFRNGRISKEAMDLNCSVLAQMAQGYRKLGVAGVRAVATSAVRDAQNQQEFLERASAALGAPVEVISGKEEARLIHLGVQNRWPEAGARRLIVDVGGGSAEIILSENGRMVEAFSKPLGALRLTEVFLENDPPAPHDLHRLESYIEEKLAAALERIGTRRFDRAIATSATAAALFCAVHRLPRVRREEADRRHIKAAQTRRFYEQVRAKDLAARRKITGIGPRRAEIIVAGAAVLWRVMQDFRLSTLYYSAAGVRDGIIADLAARGVGRELSRLSREQRRIVEEMARRYGVSLRHARKVAEMAHCLFESLQPLHKLPPSCGKLLEASAYLHDIGHYVSDTGHHKHSYYLVANSDLPGFTSRERQLIANLCRYHRKAPPKPGQENFQSLGAEDRRTVVLLTPLLRLADSLDRSHEQRVERLACHLRNGNVTLRLASRVDTDLEQWATGRVAGIFADVYNRPLIVVRESKNGSK
jgi:exopolyphosphatase/guanosine-5'-triphosphate,3'-diphosphate pyrophosphatase